MRSGPCDAGKAHNKAYLGKSLSSRYTVRMDRVRFGRALGRGARIAARTAYEAIDAAAAPNPRAAAPNPSTAAPNPHAGPRPSASQTVAQRTPTRRQMLPTPARRQAAVEAVRGGLLTPIKRASKAVSLEVTGSFFALFAFAIFVGLWRVRAMVHADAGSASRFSAGCLVGLLFAYYAVSNFQRARRLQ